mmetsp:Transcript_26804/g.70448  ORF Transcript_26804/g.70448 Transcript_26804/m.70448 type:complete len:235 (+) Transcript_26804:954-1658(+)
MQTPKPLNSERPSPASQERTLLLLVPWAAPRTIHLVAPNCQQVQIPMWVAVPRTSRPAVRRRRKECCAAAAPRTYPQAGRRTYQTSDGSAGSVAVAVAAAAAAAAEEVIVVAVVAPKIAAASLGPMVAVASQPPMATGSQEEVHHPSPCSARHLSSHPPCLRPDRAASLSPLPGGTRQGFPPSPTFQTRLCRSPRNCSEFDCMQRDRTRRSQVSRTAPPPGTWSSRWFREARLA